MTAVVVQHLEAHLGKIARGWGDAGAIQVVQFPDRPQSGVETYSTLGLSSSPLPMGEGHTVRQELIVSADSSLNPKLVASFLVTFAGYVRHHNRALRRGDVVGLPRGRFN